MRYEFADELGLKLPKAFPVRRDGKKVYVWPEDLTIPEAIEISLVIDELTIAFLEIHMATLDKAIVIFSEATVVSYREKGRAAEACGW
jgi:hypothetical protein